MVRSGAIPCWLSQAIRKRAPWGRCVSSVCPAPDAGASLSGYTASADLTAPSGPRSPRTRQVGPGFKEMFTGIGHTIVDSAKFSGQNIKEFFTGKK